MSKKASSAVNQQETQFNLIDWGSSETIRRTPLPSNAIKVYLQGALHDGTFSSNERYRFSQKGKEWLRVLQVLLQNLDFSSWIYREGHDREVYVLETLASFLDFSFDPSVLQSKKEKASYIYVLSESHENFIERIGSWHPIKQPLLKQRVKR